MRIRYLSLLTGCILMSANAVSAAGKKDEARAIVAKAIKAMGGMEKLAKIMGEEWKCNGVFHGFGMKTPYVIDYYFQRPNKFRFAMTMEMGGTKQVMTLVFDGKNGWEKSADNTQEMDKKKLAEFAHSVYIISVSQITPLMNKGYKLTALGESKIGDQKVVGINVQRMNHRDVKLFFNKKTHLMVKSESRIVDEFSGKEVTQETFVSDYKDKAGVKVFQKMTIKRGGKIFIEEVFTDQKTHAKANDKLFAKP